MECNEYVARVAVCEKRAKDALTESEKQGWLVMADSWRETVKLQEMLAPLSFVGLIAWCRWHWQGDQSSGRDEPVAKLPELIRQTRGQ